MLRKTDNDFSMKGFLRWPCIVSLVAIFAVALFFNLRGITYGLPSQERMNISLGGVEEMEKMLPVIRTALKRKIAERSESLDKKKPENFIELAKLSPYFDQVRSNNPDEFFIFKNLSYMVTNRTPIPNSFDYGAFYYYQAGGALFIAKVLGFVDTNHDAEYYLLHPEKMVPFYIAGRALSAVLISLAVAITFLIGYRLGGLPLAAFSSLLLCFLPLVNLAGKSMKPEASLMFFTALVLFFSVPVLKRVLWIDYILAGIFIGLATATKYPGMFNCSYIVMFHLMRRYSEWKAQAVEDRRLLVKDDLKLLTAGVISVLAFFTVNFAVAVEFNKFLVEMNNMGTICSRGGNIFINLIDAFLCYFEDGFWYTLGIPAVSLMTCAMIYNIFRPSKLWLGCLPGIFLYLYMSSKGLRTSDAYYMPALIPLCLIAGVWLLSFKNKKIKISLALIVIIGTFSYCWAYSQITVNRNVRLIATEWINNNIPAGSVICTLRYPVFYRTVMVSPRKYKLINQFVQGDDIVKQADYYVHTSYQWDPSSFLERLKHGEDQNPAPGFERIKEIELIPKAFFGLLPLKRDHRLNHYFENIIPKVIIFKARL